MFSRFKKKKPDQKVEAEVQQEAPKTKKSFFSQIKSGLQRTRESLGNQLANLFPGLRKIDEELLEELEEMLFATDMGVNTTLHILEKIRKDKGKDVDAETLKNRLRIEVQAILSDLPKSPMNLDHKPSVFFVVGVNGVGKTTTIGKLAHLWKQQGKSVLICAADTFRAAAQEQLEVWAKRAGADIEIKADSNDPAAAVFDSVERVKREGHDILIVDTAGRLHNNPNLMNELDKMKRVLEKNVEGAPHGVMLVFDAVTGQNALQQAKEFVSKVGVTDLVITKLDGTAKGGVAVAIAHELKLPIQYLGVGEQIDQLLPFNAEEFSQSLF